MKSLSKYPVEYIATINASGKHEKTVGSIMDCVLDDGYSLMRPLADKDKEMIHAALIEGSKRRILNNFSYLPRIACAYTVGFDKHGNTVLLIARKDLPKLERHLTPRKIDQIQRYHPKTHELQQGIEGLLGGVDKKYALDQMDHTTRAKTEELMSKGTLERVCKLLGGKDDGELHTSQDLTQRSLDSRVYDDVLIREVMEESGRQKIIKPTPFAEIIEIKEAMIKMSRIYVSRLGGERGPKKFSLSEIEQDLVEIYIPLDLARMILHETMAAKMRSFDEDHRHKMSSCARSYFAIDYFKDHEKRLMALLGK